MNAYTDIITELTLEIVRLREVIDNLIKQKDSLYEKLVYTKEEFASVQEKRALAYKEIEASKIHSLKAPTKRKDALSSKILDFIEGHAQTQISAKLIMLSLDIPGHSLGTIHAHLYRFCKQGILQRVRHGVYIKTANS